MIKSLSMEAKTDVVACISLTQCVMNKTMIVIRLNLLANPVAVGIQQYSLVPSQTQ